MAANLAERVARRDRSVVLAGLVGVVLVAWVYTIHLAATMPSMQPTMQPTSGMSMDMAMPNITPWQFTDGVFTFLMWTVMMIAMMTPSAAPMVLVFTHMQRQRHSQENPVLATSAFLASYLLVWMGFSLIIALIQSGLHALALMSSMMVSTSPVLGGVLLIAAGVYQFTPLKQACLSRCRTPIGFLLQEWREGVRGAFVMGARHGMYCVGCCWLIMTLLFVVGVMNLLWVAAITVYVLLEKLIPATQWLSRGLGVLIIGWGVWLIVGAIV